MKCLLQLPLIHLFIVTGSATAVPKPKIIFVMADDINWGQTGYRGHPVLKTPNLDAVTTKQNN